MSRFVMALLAAGLLTVDSALAAGGVALTRGAPAFVPSVWANGQGGKKWTINDGTATGIFPAGAPGGTPTTVTYTWKLPSVVPPGGAEATLSIKIEAGSERLFAAIQVQGPIVDCTGVKNSSGVSGCAGHDHAQAAVVAEVGETKTGTQNFRIAGGTPGTVKIVTTGPNDVVYAYSAGGSPVTTDAASTAPSRAESVATIVGFDRKVEIQKGDSAWQPASSVQTLDPGDKIHTGYKASITVRFPDGTTQTIGPMSLVLIKELGPGPKTRVWLRLGEVSTAAHSSRGSAADFNVKTPTTTASIRGTIFSVFYDPGSEATIVATREHTVWVSAGSKTVVVPAGKEVEVSGARISRLAPIGQANARGGIDRQRAFELAAQVIGRNVNSCALSPSASDTFAVRPAPGGWAVSVNLQGKVSGWTTWTVQRGTIVPADAAARRLAAGCS